MNKPESTRLCSLPVMSLRVPSLVTGVFDLRNGKWLINLLQFLII